MFPSSGTIPAGGIRGTKNALIAENGEKNQLEVSSSLGCQSSQAEATEEAGSLPLTGIRQNGGRCVVEAVHILPWR